LFWTLVLGQMPSWTVYSMQSQWVLRKILSKVHYCGLETWWHFKRRQIISRAGLCHHCDVFILTLDTV
jgi:hypothetical protein